MASFCNGWFKSSGRVSQTPPTEKAVPDDPPTFWTHEENGKEYKFHRPKPAKSSDKNGKLTAQEISVETLLGGWASKETDDTKRRQENGTLKHKNQEASNREPKGGDSSSDDEKASSSAPRMVISVFGWDSKDYDFHYKQPLLVMMTEDIVNMVVETGSWLSFHGTKGSAVFSVLGNALTDHQGASVVAVKSRTTLPGEYSNGEPLSNQSSSTDKTSSKASRSNKDKLSLLKCRKTKKKSEGQSTKCKSLTEEMSKEIMEENSWIEKYIICEGIVDISHGKNSSEAMVYKCTVIISADIQHLKTVINYSVDRGRPVILVKGLGLAMDYLVYLIQDGKKSSLPLYEKIPKGDRDELRNLSLELLKTETKKKLLHVYDIDNYGPPKENTPPKTSDSKNANSYGESIGGIILNAVVEKSVKENGSSTANSGDQRGKVSQSSRSKTNAPSRKTDEAGAEEHKKTLLEICIECNQFEVAKKNDLLPVHYDDLKKETLVKALKHGRENFVQYFLDHGLHYGQTKDITHNDVNDWCGEKVTLEKRVRNLICSFLLIYEKKEGEEEKGHSCCFPCGFSSKESDKNATNNTENNKENRDMLDGENLSLRNIFIWAMVTDKPELAKSILGHVHQPAAAALFACGLLRAKARKKGKYWSKYVAYKEKSREFGKVAEDSITRDYEKSPGKTFLILRRKMEAWGNMSLLHLALETRNKSFLALEPCYRIQERVWIWGEVFVNESPTKVTKDDGKGTFEINRVFISSMFPPRIMYSFNLLALFFFLMAFALLIVSRLKTESFHFLEWIMLTTIITFIAQEIGQLYKKYKDQSVSYGETKSVWKKIKHFFENLGRAYLTYILDYFNFIDFASIVIYVVAFAVRVIAYYNPTDTDWMDMARAIFSADFALFSLRLLRFCYINERLGPTVLMIIKMVKILLEFLMILTIFFLAYAVASEAVLYPESKMSWALVFHILRKPYWSMYGELFLDELEADGSDVCTVCTNDPNLYDEYDELRCASETGRYIVPVFLGIYVLIVNILLFNLLIAKFSFAVQRVNDKSKEQWSYQRAVMLREFSRYILPFPFTPLSIFLLIIRPSQPKDPFSYVSKPYDPNRYGLNKLESETRSDLEQEERDKNAAVRSCKDFCVCEENQLTLGDVEGRLTKIEEMLSRLQRAPFKSPERPRLRHAQSWDSVIIKPPESPRRGAHTHFYVVPSNEYRP